MEMNKLSKEIRDTFGEGGLIKNAAMPNTVSMAMPLARETVEVWDPIQKCKVIRYKDEIEKELYGHLYKGLFEYGA